MVGGIIAGIAAAAGLIMLAVAAVFELRENHMSRLAVDSEISDFPDLREKRRPEAEEHPLSRVST